MTGNDALRSEIDSPGNSNGLSCSMTKALFYTDFSTDPYYNMAVDEWLFEKVASGQAAVCIRLYTWSPGAITFGNNQRREKALDDTKLGQTCLIRRVTGGRALYHDPSELTYAFVFDRDKVSKEHLSGSIVETGASIADLLVAFLFQVGIEADYLKSCRSAPTASSQFHSAPCFASQARQELVAGGQKVVASAQRRIGSVTLQHGAIKISGTASHPALELSDRKLGGSGPIVALKEDRFRELADLFSSEVAFRLQLELKKAVLNGVEKQQLRRRRQYVEKCPLERRRLNKRYAPGVYEICGPVADL